MAFEADVFAWGDATLGATVDLYRGIVPRSLALVEFGLESGYDRYMLARDPVLSEMGIAGIELARYFGHDVDPCNAEASIWLGCRDLEGDARRYIALAGDEDLEDVWYLALLDFSIGAGATKHVLVASGRSVGATVRERIVAWSRSGNMERPEHAAHYGRQGPSLVRKRIAKQMQRLAWARAVGPITGAGYRPGVVPAEGRPDCLPRFPGGLWDVAHAKVALASGDRARHAAYHEEIRRYVRGRRRRDPCYVPWKIALKRWLAEREGHQASAHDRALYA